MMNILTYGTEHQRATEKKWLDENEVIPSRRSGHESENVFSRVTCNCVCAPAYMEGVCVCLYVCLPFPLDWVEPQAHRLRHIRVTPALCEHSAGSFNTLRFCQLHTPTAAHTLMSTHTQGEWSRHNTVWFSYLLFLAFDSSSVVWWN